MASSVCATCSNIRFLKILDYKKAGIYIALCRKKGMVDTDKKAEYLHRVKILLCLGAFRQIIRMLLSNTGRRITVAKMLVTIFAESRNNTR